MSKRKATKEQHAAGPRKLASELGAAARKRQAQARLKRPEPLQKLTRGLDASYRLPRDEGASLDVLPREPIETAKKVTSEQLKQDWSHASAHARRAFLKSLSPADQDDAAEVLAAAKAERYQKLIFGDGRPTVHRLNKFLADTRQRELPRDDKPLYVQAINWALKDCFAEAVLHYVPERGAPIPCTLTTKPINGGAGRLFMVRERGGARGNLKLKAQLPELVAQ